MSSSITAGSTYSAAGVCTVSRTAPARRKFTELEVLSRNVDTMDSDITPRHGAAVKHNGVIVILKPSIESKFRRAAVRERDVCAINGSDVLRRALTKRHECDCEGGVVHEAVFLIPVTPGGIFTADILLLELLASVLFTTNIMP